MRVPAFQFMTYFQELCEMSCNKLNSPANMCITGEVQSTSGNGRDKLSYLTSPLTGKMGQTLVVLPVVALKVETLGEVMGVAPVVALPEVVQ